MVYTSSSRSSTNALLFDFDGTLADTYSLFVEAINSAAKKHGFEHITEANYTALKAMDQRYVLRALGAPFWLWRWVAATIKQYFYDHRDRIRLFPGVESMIKHLAKHNELFIISANKHIIVHTVLEAYGLDSYFKEYVGTNSFFSKWRRIKSMMSAHSLAPSKTRYVWDEVRDIVASEAAGIRCIAVSRWYNTKEYLVNHSPYRVADTMIDLESYTKF